jgi:aryl-alcohol dehydrogenase-like predicted oxidoreductase
MTVPSLGFGTAAIMGRVPRRRGAEALERAYAAGIRHFDTARSYGWGSAEGVVGAFLRWHPRAEIRLVTKCGILPVQRSPMLVLAKSLARTAIALAPGLRARVQRLASADAFQPTSTYDLDALAGSLRTSLDELGLAYIDDLLLHNFVPRKPGVEDVGEWFRSLRREGVIRRYGFSVYGDLMPGLDFLARCDLLADATIQVPVSDALLDLPREWRDVTFVAHSPFAFLKTQASADGKTQTLRDLILRLRDACRCESVVCAMYSPEHLQANVAAWRECGGGQRATGSLPTDRTG